MALTKLSKVIVFWCSMDKNYLIAHHDCTELNSHTWTHLSLFSKEKWNETRHLLFEQCSFYYDNIACIFKIAFCYFVLSFIFVSFAAKQRGKYFITAAWFCKNTVSFIFFRTDNWLPVYKQNKTISRRVHIIFQQCPNKVAVEL